MKNKSCVVTFKKWALNTKISSFKEEKEEEEKKAM